jgi:hypothetical protein
VLGCHHFKDCECNATLYNENHAGWLVSGEVSLFRGVRGCMADGLSKLVCVLIPSYRARGVMVDPSDR